MTEFLNQSGPIYTSARNDGLGNPITDVHLKNAYNSSDDMIKVQSLQKKWKDSFTTPVNALNTNNWDLVQTGAGQTVSVAGGELVITSGTTINAETILMTKETFSDPFRALFGFRASQKIANTDLILEAVSVDPTGQPDGLHSVAWRVSGSDSTTTTQAVYLTQNGGLTPLASSSLSIVNAVTSTNILELELFADEVWYHARALDSSNGRSASFVRHQQIPDPNAIFKIRIRVLNRGTAPASATTYNFQFVTVVDYAELTAEITAGRGNTSAGQGMSVNVTSVPTTAVTISSQGGSWYLDSITNLALNGTYTGTSRDQGSTSALAYSKMRVMVMHLAGLTHGHLVIEQSSDATTWRETHKRPIPSDGLYRTFEFPWILRYARVKFVNGGVAQTGFAIGTALIRTDGTTDMDRVLSFVDSITALTSSATFTGVTCDLGGNHEYTRRSVTAYADQTGTLYLEQSRDGTNWRTTNTTTVNANTLVHLKDEIIFRYFRVRYVNGATANTVFELTSTIAQN